MSRPENGIYIIQGEVNLVVTAMRRNSRWSSHAHQDDEQDPLINSFSRLKDALNTVSDLDELAPNEFLSPFLEVIRSEDTTGPITGLALSSVNKFLSYRLIDHSSASAGTAIENIADAVTHARFVGTDPSSDEVVLMKILHVLRTLLLTPAGTMLTNESVCEIMQSCFRICFEMRLSELLRKSAEHTLMDMVQLLFSRLPFFKDDVQSATNLKKLMKMRPGGMDTSRSGKYKKRSPKPRHRKMPHQRGHSPTPDPSTGSQTASDAAAPHSDHLAPPNDRDETKDFTASDGTEQQAVPESVLTPPESTVASPEELLDRPATIATTPVSSNRTVVDIQQGFQKASDQEESAMETSQDHSVTEDESRDLESEVKLPDEQQQLEQDKTEETDSSKENLKADVITELNPESDKVSMTSDLGEEVDSIHSVHSAYTGSHEPDYVNPRGVRFTPHQHTKDGSGPLIPYGQPCVRELFRFLITLTNPNDRHNTDVMIHMGLSLLTVALETGADHLASFSSLLSLVKDDLCKNLFFLLQSERLSLFAASIRVCFLLFESTRSNLKFQLEMYLQRLMDIMVSESPRISYEQREIALESIVQLLRIPGLVTELYLNFDCDLYCTNLFEDLMKLLSKNAFPVSGLFTTHLLSLDALLAVIDSIEQHCHHRILHTASRSSATQPDHKTTAPTPQVKIDMVVGDCEDATVDQGSVASESNTEEHLPQPPTSAAAPKPGKENTPDPGKQKAKEARSGPKIRPNRMPVSTYIPTEEELAAIKHKKKLYQTGTEQFNVKPSKGINFLQENRLLSSPCDPGEIVTFLKENPKLDKRMIGEFISNKKNVKVLEAFQKSFHFEDARIDECLRMYVESFRLPGEAPVISYLMEHFADHWHKMNSEPFANTDAAYTLAYAVLMLNTDQHNTNAKKQNIPMTCPEFKKNLKKVNGGEDFDQEMLDEIYTGIKNEEIVMPEEQSGLVRENYLWKVLLRRGSSKEGSFIHAPTGAFDRDLFTLVWGPSVAALSFVFDKSIDETIIQKAISGFRKCAMVSAHYGISDVFDNLVISLCKFTTLLSSAESAETIPISFGNNAKAQLAARTVFGLAHRHGDILREGWKNILDCLLQLYRAKLLPEDLVYVEDFLDPSGRVSLIREETQVQQRSDSGVLSSFYSYFTLAEPTQQRGPTPEEEEATRKAHQCIQECHVEQLITESKFLRVDSLKELLKALVFASRCPDAQESLSDAHCDEEAAVFYLELLIKVVLQNRDRIGPNWQMIRDHIYSLVVNAGENSFLIERAVIGLLRVAMRLLRREEIAPQVLASLRVLLMMKPAVVHSVCRQVSHGLHDLLRTNAANIHSSTDWTTLFTLLEVVGAGTNPPPVMQADPEMNLPEVISDAGAQSDSEIGSSCPSEVGDRGYTSDSEVYESQKQAKADDLGGRLQPTIHGSWLMVNREDVSPSENVGRRPSQPKENQYTIELKEELRHHDNKSLTKSCETLAFLVRDAAHVTPHNFESCVHCIRTFVEASMNGGRHARHPPSTPQHISGKEKRLTRRQRKEEARMKKSKSTPSHLSHHHPDSDEENDTDGYLSLSIQLLDLMHTLHTRAATIFSSWAEEESKFRDVETREQEGQEPGVPDTIDAGTSTLWSKCWCPLLQGIARLCCDSRRHVRSHALTYLQRALLVHDLQTLSAVEWEACFSKVLFPLLFKLLDTINSHDPSGIEETRMRASTLLCKVFLQHLTPLLSLPTFTALWLTILDFMDKYMHADSSDLLCEAVPESLKNMLLVMHTAGILHSQTQESQLWKLTWDRINTFLPNLREEVFKPHEIDPRRQQLQQQQQAAAAAAAAAAAESVVQEPVSVQPQSQSQPQSPQQQQQSQAPPSGPQIHSAATAGTDVHGSPSAAAAAAAAASSEPRPDSPLNQAGVVGPPTSSSAGGSQYILHPPLPTVGTPSPTQAPAPVRDQHLATLPILLDPNIMQGTTIPIISPQGTPERKPEVAITVERQ